MSSSPVGGSNWIRTIALVCVVVSTLFAVPSLFGGEVYQQHQHPNLAAGSTNSALEMKDTSTRPHSKTFLVENHKTLHGHSFANGSLVVKRKTLDKQEQDESFDEESEFYNRILDKNGSGPWPSKSKSSKSGSKGSKSSSSKGKGNYSDSPSKGSKSSNSKGGSRDSTSGKGSDSRPKGRSKGSKSRSSSGKGHDSRSKGSRGKGDGSSSSGKGGDDSNSKSGMKKKKRMKEKMQGQKKKKKRKKKHVPFEYGHRRYLRTANGKEHLTKTPPFSTHISTGELEKITTQFYIYEDPVIAQARIVNKHRRMGKEAFGSRSASLDHVKTDMKGESLILEILEQHHLRTRYPEEAEIFIVPTPITELLSYGCQWENCTWYDEAFDALSKNPAFKKTKGHKHVIIALSWMSFNKRYSAFAPALSRNYARLENVTVAHNYDPFGCLALREHTKTSNGHNDFRKVYQRELPVTNAFSLGLGFNDPFPVHLPTYEKFETSEYFLFYRSREKSFAYGSTPFRNAPLDDDVIAALPRSSIGNDVPFQEWVHGFTSSKFCLVIRGDTPHSHSLLYAVRAGCIPVVVSDDYAAYATPFKSSMAIKDFAIFIKEQDFLANPTEQLLQLEDLPEDFIRAKLDNLYVAQTMVVPNHPRSLFVQAFLKEAYEAEKNTMPPAPQVEVRKDNAVLSGRGVLYRYPSTFSGDAEEVSLTNVIVGVVSDANRFNARHAIRGTWAAESQHRVAFIVAGPWEDIEEEFHTQGDLVWLNMTENDDATVARKVQLLLQVVHSHADSYDYVLKANDDTYIWLDDVEHHLEESRPDYWGNCKTKYSKTSSSRSKKVAAHRHNELQKYAHGPTFALSREFNECAAGYTQSLGLMSAKEDLATGFLAELCGVTCNNDGWDWWNGKKKGFKFIDGHKMTSAEMLYKHWYVLWKRGGWDA